MDANEGVQSFNKGNNKILMLDKSLSHLRNLRANLNITKMQNLYKCTEGVVAKLSQRRQSKQLQKII
jgi:hypothetical protein